MTYTEEYIKNKLAKELEATHVVSPTFLNFKFNFKFLSNLGHNLIIDFSPNWCMVPHHTKMRIFISKSIKISHC